ncbi:serine protein kinase RIO [Flindersiella endophytica]
MRKRDLERLLTSGVRHSGNLDEIDELYDELDAPVQSRIGRREPDRAESHARGRLTEEARERLAEEREAVGTTDDGPGEGLKWSSWDDAEARGPEPMPEWVITELAAVDRELGVLKTGKEAEVYLLERSLPETEAATLMALKRYRAADHRNFHRDASYLEGRRVRASREMRAMEKRSAFGRNLIAQRWAIAEFDVLSTLWSAGAPVPYPVQRIGTEVMMEFIGTSDGTAAPRLAQTDPSESELVDLWEQLVEGLEAIGRQGWTHGDLSAYNVLVHKGELILIDLPQVVDIVSNPQGREFVRRDVQNIGGWFAARGLPDSVRDEAGLVDEICEVAGMP